MLATRPIVDRKLVFDNARDMRFIICCKLGILRIYSVETKMQKNFYGFSKYVSLEHCI